MLLDATGTTRMSTAMSRNSPGVPPGRLAGQMQYSDQHIPILPPYEFKEFFFFFSRSLPAEYVVNLPEDH